ncbi:hypothetical protein BGZ76_011470 [Entomortierella beljakovae]|nr:hypothetical protein BGZ76_011470 [Entomortierella beljakovae]
MAVAIVAIAQEYNYNKKDQGLILAAFFFGYIITPVIGGSLADRYGGKFVLAFGAVVWTIFTSIVPAAASAGLPWMVITRVVLGLGEGVAYPSIHAMIGRWAPPSERSKAVATVTAFSYSGSVIALPISSSLVVSSWGWRSIFWLFGALGFLWSIVWHIWGASDPASCNWITDQERNWIIQQQRLDQLPTNGLHRLEGTESRQSDDALEYLDQTRTINEDGSPATYQSLQQSRLSTDSENGTHASCSSVQSNFEENDLISRVDSTSTVQKPIQHEQSRWQAFRNRVRSKTARKESDLNSASKDPIPWKALLARREVWAIIFSQLFNSFGFFVMQSWIPTFYLDYYDVDVGKIGYYSVLPSAIQGFVGLCAGHFGDKAVKDWGWSTISVRRLSQATGSLGLGFFLLTAVIWAPSAAAAMVLITIGMALNGFTLIGASAYQHDFCPKYAGFIFSLGNTAGSIPALIGVYLVGVLLNNTAGALRWVIIWSMACVFYVIGTICFVFLSTNRKFS